MDEVKTTVPKGYEVNERLSTADCVVFNRINEREWIDGGKISGYYIDVYCSIKKFDAQENRDITDKSVYKSYLFSSTTILRASSKKSSTFIFTSP
jgi:hypothetical protein